MGRNGRIVLKSWGSQMAEGCKKGEKSDADQDNIKINKRGRIGQSLKSREKEYERSKKGGGVREGVISRGGGGFITREKRGGQYDLEVPIWQDTF